MAQRPYSNVPLLEDETSTGSYDGPLPSDREAVLAELQTAIASRAFALTDELVRKAFAEMEAHLLEQLAKRLRQELPELVDNALREYLGNGQED
jgi:hypothetical protein